MNTKPIYRDDAKGQIATIKADFLDALRNQIAHSDEFIFCVDDAPAYEEYKVYLTHDEMQSAFKKVVARA